ncbi:MAG: RNA polymerase sigma factor (sigma-70 family) [Flavobacteriales bacterium]|jgi:RNA polymerase sigma factor (sigma-70 family)
MWLPCFFYMKITDTLLATCSKGDRRSQHELYKVSYGTLISVAMRYHKNEEDGVALVNQAFLKILNGLEQFLNNNPANKYPFWSKRIMINTVIDDHRKNKKHKELSTPVDFAEAVNHEGVDWNEADERFSAEDLLLMLDVLSDLRRNVFNLCAIDGYTHKEVATMLKITEGNSKWHLSIARSILQEQVQKVLGIQKTATLK